MTNNMIIKQYINKIVWLIFGLFILFYTLFWSYKSGHNPESNILLGFFGTLYALPFGTIIVINLDYIFNMIPIIASNEYLKIILFWLISMILSYIQWFILIPYFWKKIF